MTTTLAREAGATNGIRQFTRLQVIGIWASVTAPMAILAFVVGPLLAPHTTMHRGLLHWQLMVVGMIWQCLVALWLLSREGSLRWSQVRERIWAQPPQDPQTRVYRGRLWWWVLGAVALNAVGSWIASPLDTAWGRLSWGTISFSEPSWATMSALADSQFAGQWWIIALALVSAVFNYVLGEELLFRGVLLPRMEAAFGRWDWVVNTVLFGLYHVHKFWFWPSMLLGSFGIAWATRRFRSFWMGVAVHGVESIFILLVIAVVAGWYP